MFADFNSIVPLLCCRENRIVFFPDHFIDNKHVFSELFLGFYVSEFAQKVKT